MRIFLIFLFLTTFCFSQTNTYTISFENAQHHEARINISFPGLGEEDLIVRMSRTSPGRYALHEFAKNVYGVKATDSRGRTLETTRPDPHSWKISGHDGTVNVEYILFGNRADGTYSQIDLTHAHLNIPATFMYSEQLKERPIEITFSTTDHPNWKIATQLKHLRENTYHAPDLYYFMDSPTEISDFDTREFMMNDQTIRFVLHHEGTEQEFDQYFEQVKDIAIQSREIYGELPEFDYGKYVFLACYMPHVAGDGMEHRNSTVLTSTRSLAEGGMTRNIGTVAHEFFHAWNVERIRPESLEPFDFTEANMSGELWFAEGFTSYYTNLLLARSGILDHEAYIRSINGTFNYVWTSPAREFFNPIEMSYQAPFVDAATSVDPVNRENTFISYYSYGSVLGLALDLRLRQQGLSLDEFMKTVWRTYGKPEISYTIADLQNSLSQYAGQDLATDFFNNYIYSSKMPDYEELFASVGVKMEQSRDVFFGAPVRTNQKGTFITGNAIKDTPAYEAGLDRGDEILSVNGVKLDPENPWDKELDKFSPGDTIELEVRKYGKQMIKTVTLAQDPAYILMLNEKAAPGEKQARQKWLSPR